MKRIVLIAWLLLYFIVAYAADGFRFALFTDTHIQMSNLQPDEDLMRAIDEVNSQGDIDFVLVAGDITEYGDSLSLQKAKKLLDKLKMPYYITLGNHEVNWVENETANYLKVFGDDKFAFTHKNFYFVGFPTKPLNKGLEATVLTEDIKWVENKLDSLAFEAPVFAITHYPLLTGDVFNWQAMTDVLKKHNVLAVLSGHYHRNMILNYDGITGIVCRSTLRGGSDVGGYIVFDIKDEITVSEKKIGLDAEDLLNFSVETIKE